MRKVATIALGVVFALSLGGAAAAEEPEFLAVSLGAFDMSDDETSAEARIEYRSDWRRWLVAPMVGLMVNSDGGVYGYGGLYLDVFLGRRLVITPNFAIGGYAEGAGKDLGSILEFRSGVEIAYRFDNRARLGVAFQHISNAGIVDTNPGAESLVITYAIPLSGPLR